MKKRIHTFIGLLIFLTISSVNAIYAQSETAVKVYIPFDFSVRNQTITAGDYVISRTDEKGFVWMLTSKDKRQSVILLATDIQAKKALDKGKLSFRRYGEKYFLVALETSAYKIGLPKSGAEKVLEKELKNIRLAKNNKPAIKPDLVAIKLK